MIIFLMAFLAQALEEPGEIVDLFDAGFDFVLVHAELEFFEEITGSETWRFLDVCLRLLLLFGIYEGY